MDLAPPDPSTWYDATGPFVTCWLPAISATEDPRARLALEWRHARDHLGDAPPDAVAAIEALLGSERPHADDHSLLLFAMANGTLAGAHLAGDPPVTGAWVDPLPRLAPVLDATHRSVPHLVVVADRTGADIEVVNHRTGVVAAVEGDTEFVHRAHPGGWSQRRYQQRAENTWERNARGVAHEVDTLREAIGAQLVVVAGDPRAVGFLTEHASERLRAVLHHVEGAGRSDTDPFAELAGEVARLEATIVAERRAGLLESFAAASQTTGAADGPERTLAMLSQGRVADLLIHDDPADTRTAVFDRSSRQVALSGDPLADLGLTGTTGRLVDVALWAAHATGAGVHFLPAHGPHAPSGGLGGLLRG